jgi:cell filamentation protein
MSDETYCYPPDYSVLKNRYHIRDAETLDKVERELVTQRQREAIPKGDFDLKHLQAIHHHLFQDVYDWAGKVRTVEINKGGSQFQFRNYIETGMADTQKNQESPKELKRQFLDNTQKNKMKM